MRLLRVVLIVILCFVALTDYMILFSSTYYWHDNRLLRAFVADKKNPTDPTRLELAEASFANRRRFNIEQATIGVIILFLAVGIVFTTIRIRTRPT